MLTDFDTITEDAAVLFAEQELDDSAPYDYED